MIPIKKSVGRRIKRSKIPLICFILTPLLLSASFIIANSIKNQEKVVQAENAENVEQIKIFNKQLINELIVLELTLQSNSSGIDPLIEEKSMQVCSEPKWVIVERYKGKEKTTVIVEKETLDKGPFVCAFGAGEEYVYTLTADEMNLLAQKIHAEAGNQSLEGKVAVAAVALNRCKVGGIYGNTMEEVLNKEGQFADVVPMSEEQLQIAMEAAELACRGWDPTRIAFEEGALYFYAHKKVELLNREEVPKYVIGDHTFTYLYGR